MIHCHREASLPWKIVLVVLAVLFLNVRVTAQDLDNKGTEFILTFLQNHDGASNVELHLTSDVATNVTVEWPMGSPSFNSTVAVTPGNITVVTLPVGANNGWSNGTVQSNAVHAFADAEFVCYMINRQVATSDAALGLPVDVMNTDYIVINYSGATHSSDGGEFAVVAAFDGTRVTITPTHSLVGGFDIGVPFSVTLNRGEAFMGRSIANSGIGVDLTGTIISATRPVGVTSGNRCTNIPSNVTACDHIFEVAQATQSWGKQVFVTNLPNRTGGSIYRVVASADGTTLFQDREPMGTFNKGEFLETDMLIGRHVFSGSAPIFVVQFMPSQNAPGAVSGDPAMGNLIPSEQYLSSYTFSTVGAEQFASHFLTVTAYNGDLSTITLDGVPIGIESFTGIPGTSYSSAVLQLAEGTHTTSSDSTHGITVEGFNNFDSYLYPGGALFEFINPVEDTIAPVCILDREDNCKEFFHACDTGLNASGISSVLLAPGGQNLTLARDSLVPGDPCINYRVWLTDSTKVGSGLVVVKDLSGNTCSNEIFFDCVPKNLPVITCPDTPAVFNSCFDGNTVNWCVDLPIVNANSVTVSPPGPVWSNGQLCGATVIEFAIDYRVTASNLSGTDTCTVSVTFNLSSPPTLDSASPCVLAPGSQGCCLVSVTDPDGDIASLTASGLPAGATFEDNGNNTADVCWTPSNQDGGVHTIIVYADDGVCVDSFDYDIRVNRAPSFAPPLPADLSLIEGDVQTIDVFGTDPDGDVLELIPVDMPPNAGVFELIDPNHWRSEFIPDHTNVGQHYDVLLTLSDGVDSAPHSFTIDVSNRQLTVRSIVPDTGISGSDILLTSQPIVINFNEGVDPNTVLNPNNVRITSSSGDGFNINVQAPYTFVGVFNGRDYLNPRDKITIELTTGVKDRAGNPLDRPYTINLSVGEAVYPGDANNDGKVDETDLLPIGLYFGQSGPDRDSAIGLAWQLAPVHITIGGNSWSPVDAAWADADGSGTVDADDICGLALNWGKSHMPLSPGNRTAETRQALAGLDDNVLRQMRQALSACPNGQGSRGLMDMLDELVSGGTNNPEAVLPDRVELYQNYPNPFNPETVIQFALPAAQRVNLTVFNIMGQQVKVLLNQTAPAGFNLVTWDGSDRSGHDVASGIYFYRLTTENSTVTRRMTLTK